MKYKTFFTAKAYEDIREIYSYIRYKLKNTSSAFKIIDEIENKILLLRENPFTGSSVTGQGLVNFGYRKLVIRNYIAIYKVDDSRKEVYIVRVFYGKRNYQALIRDDN